VGRIPVINIPRGTAASVQNKEAAGTAWGSGMRMGPLGHMTVTHVPVFLEKLFALKYYVAQELKTLPALRWTLPTRGRV